MVRLHSLAVALGLVVAIAWGGAASAAAPSSGGTISIEPKAADGEYDPATASFVAAAAEALSARGFTIIDEPGHAAYVAELMFSRGEVGTGRAKAPTGSTALVPGASLGAGVGVVIPFSTGKSDLVPLQRTRLEMRIRRRGEVAVLWDGAAVTVRPGGAGKGSDERVAADLSEAVLRAYPNEAEGVVGVP